MSYDFAHFSCCYKNSVIENRFIFIFTYNSKLIHLFISLVLEKSFCTTKWQTAWVKKKHHPLHWKFCMIHLVLLSFGLHILRQKRAPNSDTEARKSIQNKMQKSFMNEKKSAIWYDTGKTEEKHNNVKIIKSNLIYYSRGKKCFSTFRFAVCATHSVVFWVDNFFFISCAATSCMLILFSWKIYNRKVVYELRYQ